MIKIKMLTFAIALLMSTTLLSTCNAQTTKASVKFTGIASGECILLIESTIGPQPPKAFFMGRGTIAITGSANANKYPPDQNIPFTYYYAADGAKACGVISARWDGQMVIAFLYSKGETCGLFIDENDANWFTVGALPGGTLTPSLSYGGIYKDPTGVHMISGKAGFLALPIGDPGSQFMAIGAMLFKPDGSPLISIVWTYADVTLGPGGSMGTLHAANSFIHSVNIRTP